MKFSFAKTAFALAIVNIYLLTFSTVGSMESIPDREKTDGIIINNDDNENDYENNSSIGGVPAMTSETTAPDIGIDLPNSITIITESAVPTSKAEVGGVIETVAPTTDKNAQTTPKPATNPPATTPKPATTPPPIVTTVATTTPPTTTQAPTTTAPSNPSDITTEKLTAYDKLTNTYVTKNAFELVCQNVYAEMGPSFHKEALKAQAIACYNHIKYKNGTASLPFKSLDSLNASNRKNIEDAVSAVLGKMMYIDNKIIDAAYHASSAGTTLSAKDVWGGTIPGHERVLTPFDTSDINYGLVKFISADDLKQAFSAKSITLTGNANDWIKVKSYITGKYVNKVTVGNKELTGIEFRTILNLKSAAFEIKYYDETDVFTITTYGYGHGVGLSQHGANILAKQGKTYDQILKTYYTGISIK